MLDYKLFLYYYNHKYNKSIKPSKEWNGKSFPRKIGSFVYDYTIILPASSNHTLNDSSKRIYFHITTKVVLCLIFFILSRIHESIYSFKLN